MSDTVISVPLSVEGLDEAIKQIEAYKLKLHDKCERLARLIAERVAWSAAQGFSGAIADDIFKPPGERPSPDVSVSIDDQGMVQVVMADGSDAVFIEFGAGVYYNGTAGSSPHPMGEENGFLIGEYDKGQGKKKTWALPGSTKLQPILTHGTPAAMPMYHGLQDALAVITDLAMEVFSE